MSTCCGTSPSCKVEKTCCDKKLRFKIYSRHSGKKCTPTQVHSVRNFVCRLDRRVQLKQTPRRCCY